MTLDYFYGQAGKLFSFYRIPKALFQEQRFQNLSTDAKTLYGILLDRMSLSVKNEWFDKQGRVFIIFTIEDVKRALCCADNKATKLLRELENFGLIERKRRGLGKPSLVYVKNFSSDLSNERVQNRENHESGSPKNACQDPPKSRCNKNKKSKTERNNTNPILSDELEKMKNRKLLEEYFSRSLEINNNVDSANPTENDFTPFLNIMNEWYAKDTSNKIKAVFKSRMKEGLRCSGAIPYGYKRINGDKQTLVVDEPAAEIVRKVFRLACQGMGVTAIAEQLTEEKVLIPSAYTAKYFPENCRNRSFSDPYRWNANTIGHILDRQEYLGHTVLGKSICENFKTKQRRAATPEELMIFPDTHEAIIDQDTWDIAQKLRVRAKPRAANGTYSHRLSGMIYCADCGSRMGFISPEARQSGKHYDSDSAFQCGNYRNQNNECVSHFIKTSALEAAILQAIKAVSQYVIENEAEFISQLKTVWNESKSKSANNGQQEIDEAKKRMAELDAKIQKLYDSAISGLLPERQAQRMIQQYDEEQLMLEKRVEELQGQIQEEEVEKIDTNRFIALVNKYRNCEELTDTMLYAFIDRVEVHEATGGRTVYRQQNIDIYFNFIGNYYPPVETVSEEERIAAIEAEQLRKKQEKAKRAAEVQKQKKAALMKAVEAGDPEAIAEYERKLALQRERNHRRQQKIKEAREADPAYIAQMEEKERLQREKLLEAERKRTERANRQKKLSRKELKEAAKTDPKAAEEWQALKEKEAVARQRKKEREEERMAADPEYAAMMAERKAEYTRTRTAKRQAEREALVELAKTDEEAAKKLAEMRKYQSQATVRSYQKMKADAEAGDPDAIKRYETTLAKRREEYHRKKGA